MDRQTARNVRLDTSHLLRAQQSVQNVLSVHVSHRKVKLHVPHAWSAILLLIPEVRFVAHVRKVNINLILDLLVVCSVNLGIIMMRLVRVSALDVPMISTPHREELPRV